VSWQPSHRDSSIMMQILGFATNVSDRMSIESNQALNLRTDITPLDISRGYAYCAVFIQ